MTSLRRRIAVLLSVLVVVCAAGVTRLNDARPAQQLVTSHVPSTPTTGVSFAVAPPASPVALPDDEPVTSTTITTSTTLTEPSTSTTTSTTSTTVPQWAAGYDVVPWTGDEHQVCPASIDGCRDTP